MAITLKKEVVADQWWTILYKAGDKVEQVFKDTQENIKKSEAPDVSFELVNVSTSFLGSSRGFILVKNKNLPKYEMYIGIRKYGIHLDLVWYLVSEPGLLARILGLIFFFLKRKQLVLKPSLFEEHDLRCYATVVLECFKEAVDKVAKGTGQEIEWKSKGFLGIS